ncbi:hypothetical protein FOQG_02113 [Fusarium oxysporum f. sp. raphani 54005]|uniref:Uncharacterized protein n=2 Tax=Fusarium oxysporum TaxID=5507 RepID=X0DQZ9_FUSOX|nr:hypothetical protein FOVG_07160 [Fusarium oxysporum f. sp. pisi HDV247]EXK96677.1 hypothetical protein FOQG_02113 [Fusarium oxysporum f. sp. raphani 54005]
MTSQFCFFALFCIDFQKGKGYVMNSRFTSRMDLE